MREILVGAMLVAAIGSAASAGAAEIDVALVPDGTYVVKVEKVQDTQHAMALMQNGVETMLVTRGSADFSKVKAGDTIKITLIKGKVPVLAVQ
ncbi:MAG: hypothetical protein ABI282_04175 [Candidatus Baltobacteraceae bacterium]